MVPRNNVGILDRRYTVAPPVECDGSICAAAATQPVSRLGTTDTFHFHYVPFPVYISGENEVISLYICMPVGFRLYIHCMGNVCYCVIA